MYSACILHISCMYLACILEHLQIHVSRMYFSCFPHASLVYPACIPHVSRMYPSCIARAFLAGVPTLQQLQGRARAMKRAKTAAVHLDQLIDLKHLALSYFEPMPAPLTLMPPSGAQLAAQQTAAAVLPVVGCSSSAASSSTLSRVINVPMDCALYDTEVMCFTDPMQVQWIGQLLQRPFSVPAIFKAMFVKALYYIERWQSLPHPGHDPGAHYWLLLPAGLPALRDRGARLG